MNKNESVDFNKVIKDMLVNCMEIGAVRSDIVVQDKGYQLTILVEKMDEE